MAKIGIIRCRREGWDGWKNAKTCDNGFILRSVVVWKLLQPRGNALVEKWIASMTDGWIVMVLNQECLRLSNSTIAFFVFHIRGPYSLTTSFPDLFII